jgi:hypothetical protein
MTKSKEQGRVDIEKVLDKERHSFRILIYTPILDACVFGSDYYLEIK